MLKINVTHVRTWLIVDRVSAIASGPIVKDGRERYSYMGRTFRLAISFT